MGFLRNVARFLARFTVILAVFYLVPGLPPENELESYIIPPAPTFEGPLAPRDYALNKVEKLFEDQVVGPESLAQSPTDTSTFYTTLQGGVVAEVTENGKRLKPIAKFGEQCGGLWDARKCGRPLGIRFDHKGQLVVADAYYGIFEINPETGDWKTLVYKGNEIEGKTPKIFNSVAPAKNGKIYYTVSSTTYFLDEGLGELLGSPSGRLMVYEPSTNQSHVLLGNIHFANGIVLSPDEQYVIVAECLQYRLLKHWIQGPNKGTTEIFMDGLPGFPDNLSFSPRGNILVALVSVRFPGQKDATEFLYRYPWLRKLLLRLLYLVKLPFDAADAHLNLPIARQIASHIMSFETLRVSPYSIILEVDWKGRIVRSWHSNAPGISHFSEAIVIDGYMYLGSPFNNYLGRVKID